MSEGQKWAASKIGKRRHADRDTEATCGYSLTTQNSFGRWKYRCKCGFATEVDDEEVAAEAQRMKGQTFGITQEFAEGFDPDRVASAFADAIQKAAKPSWQKIAEQPRHPLEQLEDVRLELGEGEALDQIAARYGLKRREGGLPGWPNSPDLESDADLRERIKDERTRASNATQEDIVAGQRETIEYWQRVACELEQHFDERDKVLNEKIEELERDRDKWKKRAYDNQIRALKRDTEVACRHERMRPSHRDGNYLMDKCFDCGFEEENQGEYPSGFYESGVAKLPDYKGGRARVYIQGDYLEDWE